jgi:hypothetical protein
MNGLIYVHNIINLFEIIIILFIKYVLYISTRRTNPKGQSLRKGTNFIRS